MAWLRKNTVTGGTELLRGPQSVPAFPGQAGGDGSSPRGSAFLDFLGVNDALYPEPDFASNADVGFDKNELVYACIMEKATSLPEAPFRVYGPDGMGEARENHPLRQLIANPNPATTEFELMELTSIFMDLAGIAFWEVVRDRIGRPVEIWPLRPDRVRIFPQQNGRHEYGYAIGDGKIWPLGTDVLAFKYPNPMNPNLGQAPMRPANRAVALDNEATNFVKALLQNRAVPGTVIETEQAIDEALVERLTTKWIQRFGKNNRGKPAFLQKGMKVHTLGLDLTQLEFPDLRTISESRICMSFGVPPILVGAKVGLDRSTFANYGEARRSFWEETLLPLQRRIASVIVAKLLPMFEGPRPRRVICRFDNSEVVALKESEANRWEKGTQALRAGGLMVNDFRRYVGLPRVEGGDVFLVPAGVTPVEDPSNMPAPTPSAPPTLETPDEPDETQDESTAEGQGKALTRPWARTATSGPLAQADPVLVAAVSAVVDRQRREISDHLTRTTPMVVDGKMTLIPTCGDAVTLWAGRKWNEELAAVLEPIMRESAYRGARRISADHPVTLMDGFVRGAARRAARSWNEQTLEALEGALAAAGDDPADDVAAVFEIAAGYRAVKLAVQTVGSMRNFGRVDAAKHAGIPTKTWTATLAGPAAAHQGMDGETVPIDAPFSNGHHWPSDCNDCQCGVKFTEGNPSS